MIDLCGVAQAQGFVGFTLGPALGTAETPLFTCGGGHMCMYMTRTRQSYGTWPYQCLLRIVCYIFFLINYSMLHIEITIMNS